MTTLDKIKAEIQKVLDAEPDTENAKAQALALFWVLELLDKYAEQEPTNSCDLCKFNTKLMLIEANVSGYAQGLKDSSKAEKEPCDDVVSREAVIDKVNGALDEWDGGCNKSRATLIEKAIRDLPSVRPQEQTGHWIIIDDCEQFIAKCSKCGRIEDSRMLSRYPYCHCGARMVGTQESEGTNEEM